MTTAAGISTYGSAKAGDFSLHFSHTLAAEARNKPARASLRLLAVLNVLFKYASAHQAACASS